MRPKPAARAGRSLLFGHDLVPALREMPGANPVPDTVYAPEVRQAQIAYKSSSARGAAVAPGRIVASNWRCGAKPAQAVSRCTAGAEPVVLDQQSFSSEFFDGWFRS